MKYGVLTDTHLFVLKGDLSFDKVHIVVNFTNLAEYISFASEYCIDMLFVFPETNLSKQCIALGDNFIRKISPNGYRYKYRDLQASMQVTKKVQQKRKNITIVFPELNNELCDDLRYPYEAEDLLLFVKGIEELLGVNFERDEKSTSIALLEKSMQIDYHWNVFNPTPFYIHPTYDRSWLRGLSASEKKMKYFHTIDMNAAYFSCCKDVLVGIGRCIRLETTTFNSSYNGLWEVEVQNNPLESFSIPPFITSGTHTTITITYALSLGYQLKVKSFYGFQKSGKLLYQWFCTVQNAIDRDNEAKIFHPFIKKMRNDMLGLMGRKIRKGENIKWYNRPDIQSNIISDCIGKMYASIVHLISNGNEVIYMEVDKIGYLSDKPFLESIPTTIPLSSKSGDFKYTGSYSVDAIAKFDHSLTAFKRYLEKEVNKCLSK